MADSFEDLESRLEQIVSPEFRGRLLDRGLARGLIWSDGIVPEDGPPFIESLTEDLLDYAHSVLSLALRVRSIKPDIPILERAFLVAGEAIESAIHRGAPGPSQGFHRVSAATAFHLGRYSARAYSMLPSVENTEGQNYSPAEKALVSLLRRDFRSLHQLFSERLLAYENQDNQIAERLKTDEDFERSDAIHEVLINSFMAGIACFDHALTTGSPASAHEARRRLFQTADAASDLRAVNHWWTATLAAHLIDELWQLSFYAQIPVLPEDGGETAARWNALRLNFIQRLRLSDRSSIELWPSQLSAAKRAVDPLDDLVVALPTSAGKTRIAELCILRTLADAKRVIYVTPLRALSAQIERDLSENFVPLGFSVSTLYGAAGVEVADAETLSTGAIVVATPEKLDFALRNDPSIIDDVGLIVFDEGHMLGLGEREVRYETLVQRIVRRDDADERRVVCLSALFPTPEEMKDLVGWIRQDEPGEPVHSMWRPTRQRFGTIQWTEEGAARLDITYGEEKPYIRRFLESRPARERGQRKNPFPSSKGEMVLAAAWRFVEQDKKVLIFNPLRSSVLTYGKLILTLVKQGMLAPLVTDSERLRNARSVGAEWLGEAHPAVQCLKYGVALHHGGLPRPFLSEVEGLLRCGECLITIASPTLAQGLNLSASVLLVPSIWRNAKPIPVPEFANVAGRAGRAFVDLEGLILHTIWEPEHRIDWVKSNWEDLVAEAKAPLVISGILQLAHSVCLGIAEMKGVSIEKVIEYVTGNSSAWDFQPVANEESERTPAGWDRDLASLDSALLGMIDAEADDELLADDLNDALKGSLLSRQVTMYEPRLAQAILDILAARAQTIWSHTDAPQRRAFYFAGVGLKAGLLLQDRLDELVDLLARIEAGILFDQTGGVPEAVVAFAEIVFGIAPFVPPKDIPETWRDVLKDWMREGLCSDVIETCGDVGVDFLQDAVAYRLPWAMEAVRVHCSAVGHETGETLTGLCAMAVEAGSTTESAIVLLRNGLQSRKAAFLAVEDTGASFNDRKGMLRWLESEDTIRRSREAGWPSADTRYSWLKFFDRGADVKRTAWQRKVFVLGVKWLGLPAAEGSEVILEKALPGQGNRVLSPDYTLLGITEYEILLDNLISSKVSGNSAVLDLEFFGNLNG